MTLEDNKRLMRRFVEDVVNRKNPAAVDELVAEDFREHLPFPGRGAGREGLRHVISTFLTAFPDIHWTVEEQIAEGDEVVTCFNMTGTHCGEFLGIAATNGSVNVWGIVVATVRDGKFAESRTIMDTLGLMRQLGVVPDRSAGGEDG